MIRIFTAIIAAMMMVACSGGDKGETAPVVDESSAKAPASDTWLEAVTDLERRDGFLPIYAGAKNGKILAAFPAPDEDGLSLRAIYAAGLTSGLGSNPIGLDRGLFDNGSLIAFRRIGGKLIAEQENWNYRASADNPLEKKAVRESFARSVLWASDIIAEGPDGELLLDLAGFLGRDALDVRGVLKAHPQGGDYSIASDRSFSDVGAALTFPDNVEFDTLLTLTSDKPGDEVSATAADGRAITLMQHHSLVRLPADGYASRRYDQRAGAIEVPFYDFSTPLDASVRQAFARRFRLEKIAPTSAKSPVKNPIVFYVDSGAPAQVRNALIEGASWWADAFEAAGFENAYRVELLPEDAHPRDIRYNVIQWTHRQTRGWSYGGGVHDPRTGEMIKASVILGSQRVRQDRMIFEGLAGAAVSGTGAANDPVDLALARIRQLSAHEVGHTLGFAHNFAASSNNRASVMDYPAPYVTVTETGSLELSNAYAVGIGEWDKLSATWLYAEFSEDLDEAAALESVLRDGYATGLRFVGDREARSVGTGHPYASVWDNGENAVDALLETMAVRKIALDRFSSRSIRNGQPIADLRQVIVPVYLYHRYQVAAAAKLVGGFEFSYKLSGDALDVGVPVDDIEQRRALAALIETLDPAALDLPDILLNQLTPPLGGYGAFGGGETFGGNTEPVFDILNAADSAATVTLTALMHPARAARLVEYQRRDASSLGFEELLIAIEAKVFTEPPSARHKEIARALQNRFVSTLIDLSLNERAAPAVRAHADAKLRALANRLAPGFFGGSPGNRNHNAWLTQRVNAHLNRPATSFSAKDATPEVPPGSPIGSDFMETCWHCEPATF